MSTRQGKTSEKNVASPKNCGAGQRIPENMSTVVPVPNGRLYSQSGELAAVAENSRLQCSNT